MSDVFALKCRKKSDRLEWMYSAPGHSGVNHEEYLLGKSIDKAVDPLAADEEKVLYHVL